MTAKEAGQMGYRFLFRFKLRFREFSRVRFFSRIFS